MKPITAFSLLVLIPAFGATLLSLWGPHAEAVGYFGIIAWFIVSRIKY